MKQRIFVLTLAMAFGFLYGIAVAADDAIEALKAMEPDRKLLSSEVNRLLKAEKYYEIEVYLDDLNLRRPLNQNGIPVLEELYIDLGKDIKNGPYLERWCATRVHHSAFIARGIYYNKEAWQARGGDWGRTVTGKHRQLFRQKLQQAVADFMLAYQINDKDPNSASEIVNACLGLGCQKKEMEIWFQRAVAADPSSYRPYLYKLHFLAPKWHGSFEEHTAFAQECFRNTTSGGIGFTVVLDYFKDYAERSRDAKRFYSQPQVLQTVEEVLDRWKTDFPESVLRQRWQAKIQRGLENFQEAVNLLGRIIEKHPDATVTRKMRGDIYFYNMDESKKARADYVKVLEQNPLDDQSLYNVGKCYHYDDKYYEKAIEYYDKAIAINPRQKYYYWHRGKASMSRGDYRQAIESLNQAIRIDPKLKDSFYLRGEAYYNLAEYRSAAQDFSTAIAIDPEYGSAYYWRGHSHAHIGDKRMAKEDFFAARKYSQEYAQSVERHLNDLDNNPKVWELSSRPARSSTLPEADSLQPENRTIPGETTTLSTAEADFFEGQKHFRQGSYEKAKPFFEKLLKIEPENHAALYCMGQIIYSTEQDYPKAIEYCTQAIQIDSNRASYYSLRGFLYNQQKQYESARKDFEKAVSINSSDKRALVSLCEIYESNIIVDYERESACYDKLLVALDPGNVNKSHLYKRAKSKYNLKRYREAIDAFDRLLAVDPLNCEAFFWKGYSYGGLNDRENALEQFQKTADNCVGLKERAETEIQKLQSGVIILPPHEVVSRKPIDTPGEITLQGEAETAYFNGRTEFRKNMFLLAKPYFEKVLEIEPRSHEAMYYLGLIAFNPEKEYPKALDYAKKAIEINAGIAEYHALRGDVFNQLKQYDTAVMEYEMALSIDSNAMGALERLGWLYKEKIKNYEKAFACYDKLAVLDPQNADSYLRQGAMCKVHQEKYHDAIVVFDRLLAVDPGNCNALLYKGYSYKYLNEREKAVIQFQKVVENCAREKVTAERELQQITAKATPQPNEAPLSKGQDAGTQEITKQSVAESTLQEGRKFFNQGNVSKAQAAFETLLKLEPENHEALYHLGYIAYFNERNYPKALDYADTGLGIDAGHAAYYTLRGLVSKSQKQYDAARNEFEKALSLDSNEITALTNLAWVLRNKILDYEKAAECYEKLTRLEPENVENFFNIAVYRKNTRDYEAVILAGDRVLANDPKNCEAYYWKGCSYMNLEDKQSAIGQFQKAIEHCQPQLYITKKAKENLHKLTAE